MKDSTAHSPRSCKIGEVFDLAAVTGFAGLNLVIDFWRQRLALRCALESLTVQKAPWARYALADDLESLLAAYVAGLERIHHTEEFQQDPLVCQKLGLDKLPDTTTLYRTLERFDSPEKLQAIEAVHRHVLQGTLGDQQEVILDLDSTVQTVHGRQQGACVAYNPRYRGRPSYQPLIAFDARSGAVVHLQLRSGKTPSAKEQVGFFRQAQEQLPPGCRVSFVRADAGFGAEEFVRALDREGVGYVVKIGISRQLDGCIRQGLVWRPLFSEEASVEIQSTWLSFSLRKDAPARRVVLIRSRVVDEEPAQDVLFEEDRWDYEAMVTNLLWDDEDIWHFYNERCRSENGVKELKHGLHAHAISKALFVANAADLWLKGIAYNVLLAFKRLTPPAYRRFSAERLRRALIRVPAVLVRHARRWWLRLPAWWPHQQAWGSLRHALEAT